jgi:hypothetical protein
MDCTWKKIKNKLPPGIHTRKKGKINKDLMAYVRQWQWRSKHSRDCVLRATAKQLKKQAKMRG